MLLEVTSIKQINQAFLKANINFIRKTIEQEKTYTSKEIKALTFGEVFDWIERRQLFLNILETEGIQNFEQLQNIQDTQRIRAISNTVVNAEGTINIDSVNGGGTNSTNAQG